MIYDAYEWQRGWLAGMGTMADLSAQWLQSPLNPFGHLGAGPALAHGLEVFAHAAAPRDKPVFGFTDVNAGGERRPVQEDIILEKPFGRLLRFVHDGAKTAPRLLIVAPMSGHYATLLRGTVERLLPHYDVIITDWADAKLVPVVAGRFDLNDYIDYVIAFLEHLGPNTHMLAVCQPAVPCFAATAIMGQENHPCRPRTLTMMGGPIDTREAPTEVNLMAENRPLEWFQHHVIATVPSHYPGAGRAVYPGFLQLAGFMSMNFGNHLMSHWNMFRQLSVGDDEGAEATKRFYDEYRAVCDLPAEFYLQTVDAVFKRHALPKGELTHRGRRVDPAAIHDTALFAIEGERDDISGIGQTRAALTIATGLDMDKKHYLLAEEAGHYGIFNGKKWRERIAPALKAFIRRHA